MAFGSGLLEHNGFEVVALIPVEIGVFEGFAKLSFQSRDAHGCLPFLFFSPGPESRRCARVAFPLFIGDLGCSLYIDRDLDVVALLALDCHDLDAALARRCHG